jgi:hypothetical protein
LPRAEAPDRIRPLSAKRVRAPSDLFTILNVIAFPGCTRRSICNTLNTQPFTRVMVSDNQKVLIFGKAALSEREGSSRIGFTE